MDILPQVLFFIALAAIVIGVAYNGFRTDKLEDDMADLKRRVEELEK